MASQEDNSVTAPPSHGPPGGAGTPTAGQVAANWSTTATFDIINDIYKNAGRVIFYISASNWNVVFGRIKQRIAYLSAPQSTDELSETAELKLLEVSDLNAKRLSMVLQGACAHFFGLRGKLESDFPMLDYYYVAIVANLIDRKHFLQSSAVRSSI
jgi:hypothetical protein